MSQNCLPFNEKETRSQLKELKIVKKKRVLVHATCLKSISFHVQKNEAHEVKIIPSESF